MNLYSTYDIAELKIHSAFLGNEATFYYGPSHHLYELTTRKDAFAATRLLMQDVANIGHGIYLNFLQASDIDFLTTLKTSINIPFKIDNVIASNLNTKVINKSGTPTLVPDSDGDGLADSDEASLGTSPIKWDTDGDGYGDMVEKYCHRDPLNSNPGCTYKTTDTDYDGLTDCEEVLIGSNINLSDTDFDGIPDKIEILNNLNPLSSNQNLDFDSDTRSDSLEIQQHTNPTLYDNSIPVSERYTYSISDGVETPEGSGIYKYHLRIENIGVLTNIIIPPATSAKNKIEIDITQIARDANISNQFLSVGTLTISPSEPFVREHLLSEFSFTTIE